MKKLVCDRCGAKISDRSEIEMALEGKKAWEATARASGAEPRGVIPCENFIRCGGEMKLNKRQRKLFSRR